MKTKNTKPTGKPTAAVNNPHAMRELVVSTALGLQRGRIKADTALAIAALVEVSLKLNGLCEAHK
ncbi:MAG: hypothetical protein NTV22_15510 [bacterium]|nr:hypothetical protein [bacterium]